MEEAYKQASASTRIDRHMHRARPTELLDLLGIPVVQAPSEGEATGGSYGTERGRHLRGLAGLRLAPLRLPGARAQPHSQRPEEGTRQDDHSKTPRAVRPLFPSSKVSVSHESSSCEIGITGGGPTSHPGIRGRRRQDGLKGRALTASLSP